MVQFLGISIVGWINQEYGVDAIASRLEQRLATAQQEMADTGEALQDAMRQNQVAVLAARLEQTKASLQSALSNFETIKALLLEAQALDNQLDRLSPDSTLTLSQAALLSSLYQRGMYRQAQLAMAPVNEFNQDSTINQANAALTDLIAYLQQEQDRLEARIVEQENSILSLSADVAAAESEIALYQQEADWVVENYALLRSQVAETRLQLDQNGTVAEILIQPQVPQRPIAPQVLRNTVFAALIGFMVAVFVIFFWAWWRAPQYEPGDIGSIVGAD